MDTIKKAGILAGAVTGGVLGGAVSMVGKLTGVKLVDDIGSSITNSMIYTGSLAGEAVSGTADVVSGKITKNEDLASEGWDDVKGVGKQVVGNVIGNAVLVLDSGGEILRGARHLDKERTLDGIKTLGKIASVGMLTVGAIKLTTSSTPTQKRKK